MNNLPEVDDLLKIGAGKASAIANVLGRVREKLVLRCNIPFLKHMSYRFYSFISISRKLR
jgi:hypothetical protein